MLKNFSQNNYKNAKIHIISDYVLNFDGASKNNPGRGGAGCVLYELNDEGKYKEIWNCSYFLGKVTNNEAEYKALLLGLNKIKEMEISNVNVLGDSLLVINQIRKLYKVNSKNLIPLYEKCQIIIDEICNISFQHIERKYNKRADFLANLALKNNIMNLNDFENLNQPFTDDIYYKVNENFEIN